MFRDYAKHHYGEVGKYYTSLSENILKKNYVRDTGKYNEAYEPFKTIKNSVQVILDTTLDKGQATDEIIDYVASEVKKLQLQLNQTFSLKRQYFKKEEATDFIEWLMGYFFENDIEMNLSTIKMLQENDQNKFAYLCLINQRCCICGRKVTFPHHVDRVGTHGYKNDDGINKRISPLCAYHHAEIESGKYTLKEFEEKYPTFIYLICDETQIPIMQKIYKGLFSAYGKGG